MMDLRTVLRLRRRGFLANGFSVADVGTQQIANNVLRSPRILRALAKAFGVPDRSFGSTTQRDDLLPADAPYAKDLWEWLGCSYTAFDIDQAPHKIKLDLNFDEVPPEHKGRYQLVANLGTTEHVANQLQAMKVIHDLTAPGGIMIHNITLQGFANHGLINYNPKFFWMLSRGCRYHWLHSAVTLSDYEPISPDIVGEVNRLSPVRADRIRNYRLRDAGGFFVLQKREDIPFVPPIDLGTAALEEHRELLSRYWPAD